MNKPLCIISCPIDVYSGYSSRSRDIVKSIIELKKDEWNIQILSQRWGDCAFGFIDDNKEEWGFLNEYILKTPLQQQPDYWFQITIPSEFQPVGRYNVGITAGIESTVCPPEWIQGVNRMNITWVSSNHAKNVFEQCSFEQKDQQGRTLGILKLEKPIEVVFEGCNLDIYKYLPEGGTSKLWNTVSNIKEEFCYLNIGHWMAGEIGEDRKNIGLLVKAFFETFKNKPDKPALILKTSGAVSSYMDRDNILNKIYEIKKTVSSKDLPNIYLLHGDFEDKEINELYNHPKVKAMVSLTKGEGFGRPLLEFSIIRKPIITSGWSGHLDFLMKDLTVLLGGELKNIHPSAANQWLLKEGMWFNVNHAEVGNALMDVYKHYNKYLSNAKQQSYINKEKFSYDAMKSLVKLQLNKFPTFAQQIQLKLPTKNLNLPKLQKL